jgi:hypothetical protein
MVRFYIIFFLAAGFILNCKAQNVTANAYTDTTDYLVGDFIPLTIKVKYDRGIKVQTPSINDIPDGLELIKTEEPELDDEDGKAVVLFRYIVSKYDSADVELPPIALFYTTDFDTTLQAAYTNPLVFTVHTLQVEPEGDIKDVKEPIKIPLEWWMILAYVFAALVAAALAYLLYKKHQKKKAERLKIKPVPKIPPYLTALNALHELEEQELWQKGLVKEYHSRITEIIRRYFEDRFYLPALELTTSEAMKRLSERRDTYEILELTGQFLNNADLVKFAKYKPADSVNEEMMKQAYQIVEKTIPRQREENREAVYNAG